MFVEVNNLNLYYMDKGTGKPVLFLHGNGEDHSIFDALTANLSVNYRTIALDSRCHGQSQKASEINYIAMADDVCRFIRALDLKHVNIVGFSDGAIVGLFVAMYRPDLVAKLSLLGPNLSPDDFKPEELQAIRDEYALTRDPLLKLMLEQPQIAPKHLRNIATPTLIIAGEHDVFKPETFVTIHNALPNSELKILPGQYHGSYVVNSDMLSGMIKGFVGE